MSVRKAPEERHVYSKPVDRDQPGSISYISYLLNTPGIATALLWGILTDPVWIERLNLR
jgi:hypothetical protein